MTFGNLMVQTRVLVQCVCAEITLFSVLLIALFI